MCAGGGEQAAAGLTSRRRDNARCSNLSSAPNGGGEQSDPIGVVSSSDRTFFIRLARVTPDPKPFGRRIWIALATAAGIAVVILSWRVPEPETHNDQRPVENMSYLKYVPQQYTPAQAPPPNYGAR